MKRRERKSEANIARVGEEACNVLASRGRVINLPSRIPHDAED